MLISGPYNPPKHNYQVCDLMSHVINFLDNTLDKDPNTVFVCGGDLIVVVVVVAVVVAVAVAVVVCRVNQHEVSFAV